MSRPITLQEDFSLGAMSDVPRYQLPKGKVWSATNMIPNLWGGALVKRGPWSRPYDAMSQAGATYASGVGFARYSSTAALLGFDEDGRFYKWAPGGSSVTDVGAAYVPAHPPTFYRDLSILLDGAGASAPKKYDGTTLAALSGSPPNGSVSCVFKDHLVLAHSSANKNRVWFSNAGDPQAWDTAVDGQWLDCGLDVQGLAVARNMILVFQEGQTERIRGDIIPGVVGSDIVKEPLHSVGCSDPASIAVSGDNVIFANGAGIFQSDGIGLIDLTKEAGILRYWQERLAGYDPNVSIAGALWKDWYFVSVSDFGAFVVAGMLHVSRKIWVDLANVHATMMVATPVGSSNIGSEWLWMSERDAKYVSNLGQILSPGVLDDGDGDAVACSVELPFYRGRAGLKRWKNLYVTMAGSNTSTLIEKYYGRVTQSPLSSPTYATVGTIGSTSGRKKFQLNQPATEGIGLKISQSASGSLTLYGVEADVAPVEAGRVTSSLSV